MSKKLQKSVFFLLIVLLIAAAIISYAVYRNKTLYHYRVVDQGRLYRSGTLSNRGLDWVGRLSGIKSIVNLRSVEENKLPWHKREIDYCRKNGINFFEIPMEAGCPPSDEQVTEFLTIATDPALQPVLVHCEAGVVRTGMMVTAYRVSVMGEKDNKKILENSFRKKSFDPPVVDFMLNYKHKDEFLKGNRKKASGEKARETSMMIIPFYNPCILRSANAV